MSGIYSQVPMPYSVRTRNISIASDNKIHDDDIAARHGFRGGLVAGTLMYAHMTTPVVARLGPDWLHRGRGSLRLLNPAFDGEELSVHLGGDGPALHAQLYNEANEELAQLNCDLPDPLPTPAPWAARSPAPHTERAPITWEAVREDMAFMAFPWRPDAAANRDWCEAAGDTLPLYQEGATPHLHPGLVLQAVNAVFGNHFILNPWIHVGSEIQHRAPLFVGDAIEVRAVVTEKKERKGHQFITYHASLWKEGASDAGPAVEVTHTAIFRVRTVAD